MEAPRKNLMGAGLLAATLFLFWALVVPSYQDMNALRAAINERGVLIADRAGLIARVAKFKEEYTSRVSDIRKFSAVVPATTSAAELISSLEQMAQAAGIQMNEVSVTQDKGTKGQYGTVAITVRGGGSYSSFVNFLRNFERNVRLIDIQTLELSQNATILNLITFTVKATAYSLK